MFTSMLHIATKFIKQVLAELGQAQLKQELDFPFYIILIQLEIAELLIASYS